MLDLDVSNPFYPGLDGKPLQSGLLYFGVSGQNPATSPITPYWDSAGTQPAAQPISIMNGKATRDGTPAVVWVGGDYSRLVLDARGRQVLFDSVLQPGANNAKPLKDYPTLRAYTGSAMVVVLTASGVGGAFALDASDTSSADNGGTVIVSSNGNRWKRIFNGPLLVEWFGASATASASANATALAAAIAAAPSSSKVTQQSAQLTTDGFNVSGSTTDLEIKLNLKSSASPDGVPVVKLTGFTYSVFDISIDGNGANVLGLRADGCTGSVVPRSALIKNLRGTSVLVAGLLTRDSDDMTIAPTVSNITGNGAFAVRGVMISDTTITKNTSAVAPRIATVTQSAGGVDDADGVYAEHSNVGHLGGLKFIGGDYRDCGKRFIKCTMPNPTIVGNSGRTNLATQMYSFVSVYDNNAGTIDDNTFESVGAGGVLLGLEFGVLSTDSTRVNIGKNKLYSATVAASSRAYRFFGAIPYADIDVGDVTGFQSLLLQSSGGAATGQMLTMRGGRYDNLSAAASNCIQVSGDFAKLNIKDVYAVNAATSVYFISAPDLTGVVAEIIDNTHTYSFGTLNSPQRPLNMRGVTQAALNSEARYELGRAKMRRDAIPVAGTWAVGDVTEMFTPAASGQIGWVCTTAGTPGTWKAYGVIAA